MSAGDHPALRQVQPRRLVSNVPALPARLWGWTLMQAALQARLRRGNRRILRRCLPAVCRGCAERTGALVHVLSRARHGPCSWEGRALKSMGGGAGSCRRLPCCARRRAQGGLAHSAVLQARSRSATRRPPTCPCGRTARQTGAPSGRWGPQRPRCSPSPSTSRAGTQQQGTLQLGSPRAGGGTGVSGMYCACRVHPPTWGQLRAVLGHFACASELARRALHQDKSNAVYIQQMTMSGIPTGSPGGGPTLASPTLTQGLRRGD